MSMQRHCFFYKATDNNWYMELADREYGEVDNAFTYGPFHSQEAAIDELDNHSNPGGWESDSSGEHPVPSESPNGSSVRRLGSMGGSFRFR